MKPVTLTLFWLLAVSAGFAQETEIEEEEPDSLHTYTSMAEAMKYPEAVLYLDLSKQKLKEFPAEILKCKNLRSLNLSKNKIETIPAGLSQLTKLEELDLSRNKITVMPAELFELKKLRRLIINQNLIESIPSEIRKLQQLEYLDMWSNELEFIPNEIGQLQQLKEFDLRNIQINNTDQQRIVKLLPNTKIHFSQSCNCGN